MKEQQTLAIVDRNLVRFSQHDPPIQLYLVVSLVQALPVALVGCLCCRAGPGWQRDMGYRN